VHSPKNFHIEEGPSPDSGDHTGNIHRKPKARIRKATMKAKKKAAAKKAPAAKKPAAKKKAKK
jgi:hypothetical protein